MTCEGCDKPLPPSRGRKPRKWCSERCRKNQYRVPCERCGAPCGGIGTQRGGHAPSRFCVPCGKVVSAEFVGAEAAARIALAEKLWARGDSLRQIAEAFGWAPGSLRSEMWRWRAGGADLPFRKQLSPEGRRRISEAAKRARAAERERRAA